MGTHLNKLIWLLGFLFLVSSGPAAVAAEAPVGEAEFVRGTVAVERSGRDVRMLGKGEAIFQGDTIQTSGNSFTVLFFNDGTKITIRPDSSLGIDVYSNDGDNPMADLSLQRGGVKISTGDIGRKNPDNFKVHTDKATVKASEADYTVRVCGEECALERENLEPSTLSTSQTVAARVVEIEGSVTARTTSGSYTPRMLNIGAPLYSTDRVDAEVDSYAAIVFRDASRLTIQSGSSFEIKDYSYESQEKENAMKLGLIKGGLRVLTRFIGKMNKEAFSVDSPVVAIGVRGTGFDLMFIREQDDPETYKIIGVAKSTNPGVYAYVWEGAIVEKNDAGEFVVEEGQVSIATSKDEPPKLLDEMPPFFKDNPNPRPDQIEVDMNNLFGTGPVDGSSPGVYVTVENGHVEVVGEDGAHIDLGKNEAAFVDLEGTVVRMEVILNFQIKDPYPMPRNFSPETADVEYSLLIDDLYTAQSAENPFYHCRCD